MKADGDKLVVKFRNAEGGLVSKGENGEVTGFAIAGADGSYDWAEAKIDGDSVVLTCKGVPKPVAVRYAWGDNPKASLYDKADLPASPFRAGEEHFAPTTKP
jgi:sialate O-acetylesterase